MDYLRFSQDLKNDADRLIVEAGIKEKLSKLGEVKFRGSYAHNVMAWPDIDLLVVANHFDDDAVATVTAEFYREVRPYWLKIEDFRQTDSRKEFPRGIYFGLRIKHGNKNWKIDTWLLTTEQEHTAAEEFGDWLDGISDKDRELIIRLKHELIAAGIYPKEVTSVELYKVVQSGAKNITDIMSKSDLG